MKTQAFNAPEVSRYSVFIRHWRAPLLLAGLYLVSRLLILLANYESVSDVEELLRGTIAREFVTGLKKPLVYYAADSYSGGGSIVTGMVASIFFRLLGPNYFSLKIVPVLFYSLPTLFLTYFFMKRNFGKKPALLAGLFFVFAPRPFFATCMNAWGCYSIGGLAGMGMFFVLYEILFQGEGRKRAWAILGFLGSMGFWVAYPVLMYAAAAVASLLIFKKKSVFGAGGLAFASAFAAGTGFGKLAGLMPGFGPLGYFAHYVFAPRFENSTAALSFWGFFEKLGRVIMAFSHSFWADYRWLWNWETPLSFATLALGLAGLTALGVRRLSHDSKDAYLRKCVPFLLMFVFFFFVYAVSRVPVPTPGEVALSYRYYAAVQFYLFCFMASAFTGRSRAWILAAVLICVYGLGVHASLLRFIAWGDAFRHKGYSYYQLGELWQPLLRGPGDMNPSDLLRRFEKEEDRNAFYHGFILGYPFTEEALKSFPLRQIESLGPKKRRFFMNALGRYYAFNGYRDLAEVSRRVAALKYQEAASFYTGLGFGAVSRGDDLLAFYISRLSDVPEVHRPFFYFSLGILLYNRDEAGWPRALRLMETLPAGARKWVYRGMGRDAAVTWLGSRMRLAVILETVPLEVPAEMQEDFCWGLGWGVRSSLREDRERALQWIRNRVPAGDQREAALRGLESFEKWNNAGPYAGREGEILFEEAAA